MTPDPAQVDVAERICEVKGCTRKLRAKGLCATHWSRLKRRGSLDATQQWQSGPERLWANVDKTPTCWLWTGPIKPDGYAVIMVGRKSLRVHRYAWQLLRGAIPDDLVLDHICRIRHCVNPDHLEPVRQQTNVLRGIGLPAINARKTHCIHGHEFTPDNTYRPPGEPTRRICRVCMQGRKR